MSRFSAGVTAGQAGGGAATYRYLRIDVSVNNGGNRIEISEIEWFVGTTEYPTVNMTAASAPSPLVASASTEVAGGEAWKAFDGDISLDGWISGLVTAGALTIDLGAGNGIAPAKVQVRCGTTADRAPKDFTLLGSDTGAFAGEETTLGTVTGATAWTSLEEREYIF